MDEWAERNDAGGEFAAADDAGPGGRPRRPGRPARRRGRTGAPRRLLLDAVFTRVPLVALPTLVGDPATLDRAATMYQLRATMPVNLAGLPALSLPVRRLGRLPTSLQLIGPAGSEDLLLATAERIESAIQR